MASMIYALMPQPNQDACQHRDRVAEGEDADVDGHVLHPVEEEDDAKQEQDVVVSRHHVLGAKIDEGDDVAPPRFPGCSPRHLR